MALGPDDWIALDDAKAHLNKAAEATADDAELEDFIRRAQQAIVDRIGYVKQPTAALVEYHRGGGRYIRLDKRPVFEVDEIAAARVAVAAADRDAAAPDGWYVDSPKTALVEHTGSFPAGLLRVTYRPGYPEVPHSIEQAALELLRHMWRTQRGALGGRRVGARGEEPTDPAAAAGAGYLLPHRVEQLLHPYVQIPVA